MRISTAAITWLVVSFALTAPLAVQAYEAHFSYYQIKDNVVRKDGSRVVLFHNSAADVKKDRCLNDVIPVYRKISTERYSIYYYRNTYREVGKVRVAGYIDDNVYAADVVSGEAKIGDVAVTYEKAAPCPVRSAE